MCNVSVYARERERERVRVRVRVRVRERERERSGTRDRREQTRSVTRYDYLTFSGSWVGASAPGEGSSWCEM